jgi:GT2 family glycosyltransferase
VANVLLGCPTHDGRLFDGCASVFYRNASQHHRVQSAVATFSLLTVNCNILWAMALNAYEAKQADWFALIHSDVQPEPFWIDRLIAEADAHRADLMSAVIAIKNDRGLTSTAISDPNDDGGKFIRLTTSQVRHPSFPVTFDGDLAVQALRSLPANLRLEAPTGARLLCNTGCIVCRLGPWCDPRKVYFDEVTRFERINNQWKPFIRSEDWFFTGQAVAAGAKLMATTTLKVSHLGLTSFPNDQAWGSPLDDEGLAQWDALSKKPSST